MVIAPALEGLSQEAFTVRYVRVERHRLRLNDPV